MLNRVRVSFGLRALHRRAKAVRRVNDLGRRRSLDANTAVRMCGVGIDLGQPPVLDSRDYAASGNAHGTIGVSCWMAMEVAMIASFGRHLLPTKSLARSRRNQNSEYLAQRRKALSFRPEGEIFPRSLASLGMTDLGPSLGVLGVLSTSLKAGLARE